MSRPDTVLISIVRAARLAARLLGARAGPPAGVMEGQKSDGFMAWWISPLYLWLGFLSAQPHKEERFMFVVYPLLGCS